MEKLHPHIWIVVVILSILAIAFVFFVHNQRNDRNRALLLVKNHFADAPIGGGWIVSEIKPSGGDIHIKVLIPQAEHLMDLPYEQQFRIVAGCCPNRIEPLWRETSISDIIIEGSTTEGKVFIDVPCKEYGQ